MFMIFLSSLPDVTFSWVLGKANSSLYSDTGYNMSYVSVYHQEQDKESGNSVPLLEG